MTIDEIIKVTGVYSGAVYAIIFTVLLVVGYYIKSNSLYNVCADKMDDNKAATAWFPLVDVMAMAKSVDSNPWLAFISSIIYVVTLAASVALCILNVITIKIAVIAVLATYLIYSACHYLILRKYMHTYFPETSELCIVACCIIPLFKLYIHADIKK